MSKPKTKPNAPKAEAPKETPKAEAPAPKKQRKNNPLMPAPLHPAFM